LFSGKENSEKVKEIWLVDPAPTMIKKFEKAVEQLEDFMETQGLEYRPEDVRNLKGDTARAMFINKFKEVQRVKTQLDQYTDINEEQASHIEALLPEDKLRAFRGAYLDIASRLKDQQEKSTQNLSPELQQLDFEFVLFSSAIIDYDYIMALISRYTQSHITKKEKVTKKELIDLIASTSNLMEEREDIEEYIEELDQFIKGSGENKGLSEREVMDGYQKFKADKSSKELNSISERHGIKSESLKTFIDEIMERMIFDGEKLTDLLEPLNLSWRERTKKELALMEDLIPLLKKMAGGREIVGLKAYE